MSNDDTEHRMGREVQAASSSPERDHSLSEQDQDQDGGDHSLGGNSGGGSEDLGDHSLGAHSGPADDRADHSLGQRSGETRQDEDADHQDHSLGDR